MTAYDLVFRHLATRVDAERAHDAASRAIRVAGPAMRRRGEKVRARATPVTTMGLTFAGRLGLAAGFDKNARGIDGLAALGFGHVEIGTVTGEPQPGNDRPRLFRLPDDAAILNRMGFNNDGAEAVARRLAQRAERRRDAAPSLVLGVNIGKTKVVPPEHAVADYEKSAGLLAPHADYLVVNVSSPNTPGLRDLQAVEQLEPLLTAVRRRADQATERGRAPGPAAGQDRPRPRRRGRRRRRRAGPQPRPRRHHRHQHHDLARRARDRRGAGRPSSAPGE